MKLIFDVDSEDSTKKGIYKISNNMTGMVYIGRTNCFLRRYYNHYMNMKTGKSNFKINRFISKYPYSTFTFSIIEITDDIKNREEYWIKKYDSVRSGFNILENDEEFIKIPKKRDIEKMKKSKIKRDMEKAKKEYSKIYKKGKKRLECMDMSWLVRK